VCTSRPITTPLWLGKYIYFHIQESTRSTGTLTIYTPADTHPPPSGEAVISRRRSGTYGRCQVFSRNVGVFDPATADLQPRFYFLKPGFAM